MKVRTGDSCGTGFWQRVKARNGHVPADVSRTCAVGRCHVVGCANPTASNTPPAPPYCTSCQDELDAMEGWLEREKAKRHTWRNLALLVVAVVVLGFIIGWSQS